MRKSTIRWMTILLTVVLMLTVLGGCGQKQDVDAGENDGQSQDVTAPADDEANQDEDSQGTEEDSAEPEEEEPAPAPQKTTIGAADELPDGGIDLLDKFDMKQLRCGTSALGEAKYVEVEGMPFTQTVQAITKQPAKQVWDIQLIAPIKQPVKLSDTIVIRFYIRALEGENDRIRTAYIFEKAGDPYTKSLDEGLEVGKEWKKFQFAFSAKEAYEAGGANLIFRMGVDKPQIMEIGGLELINYGREYTPDKFEKVYPEMTYDGREADAAWRAEAEARIEEIRKGDMKIQVVDAAGNPVENAKVQVNMKQHDFGFGTAVSAGYLFNTNGTTDNNKYREEIPKLFNLAVIENGLKWPMYENEQNRKKTDEAIAWLKEQGLEVRGHNLIWPGWTNLPKDLQNLKDDKDALRKRINDHIREEAAQYKGQLVDWDVVNEAYYNHDIMDILGEDELLEWFKIARAEDPGADLYLNETGIPKNVDVANNAERILKNAMDKGVKIDGLGIQSHYGNALEITPPEKLVQVLDRFGALVDHIKVTEMDFNFNDEQLEADYMRDLMTVYFSNPKVNGILMWGFWDGAHWWNHAPIFTKDWQVRASGEAYKQLVFEKWWTNEEGTTDDRGSYQVRGFLGDYDIIVESNGKTKTVPVHLVREGATVKVVLD